MAHTRELLRETSYLFALVELFQFDSDVLACLASQMTAEGRWSGEWGVLGLTPLSLRPPMQRGPQGCPFKCTLIQNADRETVPMLTPPPPPPCPSPFPPSPLPHRPLPL